MLLHLGDNQITSIPPEIGNLSNLRELYLEDNQLTSIPDNIASSSISYLELSENNLTSLPQNICYLPATIRVNNNNLCKAYDYDCSNFDNYSFRLSWGKQNYSDCCIGPDGQKDWANCSKSQESDDISFDNSCTINTTLDGYEKFISEYKSVLKAQDWAKAQELGVDYGVWIKKWQEAQSKATFTCSASDISNAEARFLKITNSLRD